MNLPILENVTLLHLPWGVAAFIGLGVLSFLVLRRLKIVRPTTRVRHANGRLIHTTITTEPTQSTRRSGLRSRVWNRIEPTLVTALVLVGLATASFGSSDPAVATQTAKEQSVMCLILDNSESMEHDDIDPTRIDAMKEAATKVIERSPADLQTIVVTFAGETDIVIEPTLNKGEALRRISKLQVEAGGTALGEGIFTALDVLESMEDSPLRSAEEMSEGEEAPVACIALSDGASLEGREPVEAAEKAAELGVPIYTVGFADPATEEARYMPDIPVLMEVASITTGEFKEAVSTEELEEIFDSITAKAGTETSFESIGFVPTTVGLLVLVTGLCLGVLRRGLLYV